MTIPMFNCNILLHKLSPVIWSDKLYVKLEHLFVLHKKLHLSSPILFSEKLQWLKLYDRKEIYHQMVDKYEVKRFIANKIGDEYNIPTLGVWDSFEEIDFESLPEKFILKGTFDSGSFYVSKDKSAIDKTKVKERLYRNWNRDYYLYSREWPYKGLKHRIIGEPLLEDPNCPYLRDFKFYCFHGEPRIMYITSDKGGDLPTRQDFFDMDGNHLDMQDAHYPSNPVKCPDLPINFDKMKDLCRVLAKDTYHLRVDFYEIEGKILVGELTFYEAGGYCEFKPEKYNKILGDWIKLPIDE